MINIKTDTILELLSEYHELVEIFHALAIIYDQKRDNVLAVGQRALAAVLKEMSELFSHEVNKIINAVGLDPHGQTLDEDDTSELCTYVNRKGILATLGQLEAIYEVNLDPLFIHRVKRLETKLRQRKGDYHGQKIQER